VVPVMTKLQPVQVQVQVQAQVRMRTMQLLQTAKPSQMPATACEVRAPP